MKKFEVWLGVFDAKNQGVSLITTLTVSNADDPESVLRTLKRIIETYPRCA